MKKMRRQLLSGLCVTALVVGMMPGAIWASDVVTYFDMGEDVSSGAALDGYSDAASVSDWAGESVEWAVAEGLLSGVTNDELAPQGSATRAQVAAMLERFNAR